MPLGAAGAGDDTGSYQHETAMSAHRWGNGLRWRVRTVRCRTRGIAPGTPDSGYPLSLESVAEVRLRIAQQSGGNPGQAHPAEFLLSISLPPGCLPAQGCRRVQSMPRLRLLERPGRRMGFSTARMSHSRIPQTTRSLPPWMPEIGRAGYGFRPRARSYLWYGASRSFRPLATACARAWARFRLVVDPGGSVLCAEPAAIHK